MKRFERDAPSEFVIFYVRYTFSHWTWVCTWNLIVKLNYVSLNHTMDLLNKRLCVICHILKFFKYHLI